MDTIKDIVKKLQDSWNDLSTFEKVLVVAVVWAIVSRVNKK